MAERAKRTRRSQRDEAVAVEAEAAEAPAGEESEEGAALRLLQMRTLLEAPEGARAVFEAPDDPLIALDDWPRAMHVFRAHVRRLLLGGIPGNELSLAVVAEFDLLDGERSAARDQDKPDPHPQVRL